MNEAELSTWQDEVWKDDHRYKVINCGRRAGKSFLTAAKMVDYCSNNDNSIVWYIAPNYRQAKQIMWQMVVDFIPEWCVKKKNETELIIWFTNGSKLLLKGAENPDSLRGVRIDLAVFDEVAFISKWDEVWKVIRPTLMDSKADVWFISTPNGFNHFKRLYEKVDDDWASFHFTTYDNPHIPREEIESSKEEMDDDSFAQEIMGEFKKMSGLVYKDFRRITHMVQIPDLEGFTFTRAIDFGFNHKTALGYFAINSTGTEIYMYDGIYESGLTMKDIASAVKIKDAGKIINNPIADSAQPLYLEELSRENVHFNPVVKGPDSVQAGITKLAELLKIRQDTGKPTLMFNKNLPWIADEMEKYRWMENKTQGIIKNTPLKREDDAVDMCRYFAMNYMGGEKREYRQPSRPRLTYGRRR
jgi:PBSX family phage terminase large subunit